MVGVWIQALGKPPSPVQVKLFHATAVRALAGWCGCSRPKLIPPPYTGMSMWTADGRRRVDQSRLVSIVALPDGRGSENDSHSKLKQSLSIRRRRAVPVLQVRRRRLAGGGLVPGGEDQSLVHRGSPMQSALGLRRTESVFCGHCATQE